MGVDPVEEFKQRNAEYIARMSGDAELAALSSAWFNRVLKYEYAYHFTWMGRPIIQFPQDILVLQEIIWEVKPDLIIETGIAHGGSIIFSASMLELIGGDGEVLGIDTDIRKYNRLAIETHPMYKRVQMIEGSSTDATVLQQVRTIADGKNSVMVILDSNRTHAHVFAELQAFAPLVSTGSYLTVLCTCIESLADDVFPDKPWGKGNNPGSAVDEFLAQNGNFAADLTRTDKLLITVSPNGYLRRIA